MQNKKAADSLLTICYFTESKLIPICLLPNSLEVHIFLFQKTHVYKGISL
ncbi:hypothetical protein bcere0024_059350 [Bacillus cereus Rock4-18]|nr:hypothetical protein bcere0024_059350 [Bacillus cereus Rock4-18]